ncbi:MAG TPA: hypothetical protein VMT34_04790 [Aggregatilineales bacterium]|nr:hypothetical protein [Aggregatilineales bacterium]
MRQRWRIVAGGLGILSVAVVIAGGVALARLSLNSPAKGVYVLKGTAWQRVSTPFTSAVAQLQFGFDGDGWVKTRDHHLFRYHAGTWTNFTGSEVSIPNDPVDAFGFNGRDAWVMTHGFLLHFDAVKWTTHVTDPPGLVPHALTVNADATVIMAFDSGQIAMSGDGVDVRFNAVDVLPGFVLSDSAPMFQNTGRTTWLLWGDLWRLDGSTWTPVWLVAPPMRKYYRLLCADSESVWLTTETGIGRIDAGNQLEQYSFPAEFGDHLILFDGTVNEGVVWLATSAGIVSFDSGRWSRALPAPAGLIITHVAFDPQGQMWMTVEGSG